MRNIQVKKLLLDLNEREFKIINSLPLIKKNYTKEIKHININHYSLLQKIQILNGLIYNLDVSYYLNEKFSWKQMDEIRTGLELGIDVDLYNKIYFSHTQMNFIKIILISKKNPRSLLQQGFNNNQSFEIFLGLINDLNVSNYDKRYFSSDQMKIIRYALTKGFDVSIYTKEFNYNQMKELYLGQLSSVDVLLYHNPSFSSTRMEFIREELEKEHDVTNYITKK